MVALFWIQLRALIWKNWIVLSKHWFLNVIRCFILPVAYGAFLATAQIFFNRPNNLGLGQPVLVGNLTDHFDGSAALIWADGTNGTSNPTPQAIIAHITSGFSEKQLNGVRRVDSVSQIPLACPQNFNLRSTCFAAVAFNDIPSPNEGRPINYTIRADAGLAFIDVEKHTSDYELRLFPLQWAIDKAVIELQTGVSPQTPQEWPYTKETNEEQATKTRLSYVRGLRELLVLALFICYIGIAYQLPGAVAGERAGLLTSHMKAMGLLDSARIISWHLSISLPYVPAWVIVALIWRFRIFAKTSVLMILAVHLLLPLSLASWSFFVAAPFGKSPQLAAVISTFLAILFAVLALVFKHAHDVAAFIFTIIFPPGFYIFALRAMAGWENNSHPTNALKGDPDNGLRLLPLLIAALIDVFLWPYLAVLLEHKIFDVPTLTSKRWWQFWKKGNAEASEPINDNVAISVKHLNKTFKTSLFTSKNKITAVADLSLEIPKTGIYVLLGSNGAGKSTSLSIMGGLLGRTGGSVTFAGGVSRPPRGTLGIVPQKNVLFSELTCLQTLRVWHAVKRSDRTDKDEDLEQLLKDCDLGQKIHANADTLSGGQKRKLQLAIGLLGGSSIVLVDECTSGVDPLSRRALWRTLTSFRDDRAIVFTTHFLDEADLLADHIAILAAPGKLVASGSPVTLKRSFGEGYSIVVTFKHGIAEVSSRRELLSNIRTLAPDTHASSHSPSQLSYSLKSKDDGVVQQILQLLDAKKESYGILSYDILGTTIEDIFLGLMNKHDPNQLDPKSKDIEELSKDSLSAIPPLKHKESRDSMRLATGRRVSPFRQAFTIFHKRLLILRRSWLTPLLTVGIAIAGSCIPLVFLTHRAIVCGKPLGNSTSIPLYLPSSPIVPFTFGFSSRTVDAPPGVIRSLGPSANLLRVTDEPDVATFTNYINQNYRNLSVGGVAFDFDRGETLVAWEATSPGLMGLSMLNLASNVLYNRALNQTNGGATTAATIIRADYSLFPPIAAGTLVSLKWLAFFGAVMAVYPAFFALYVSRERRSSVQAMQLSNGLADPIGLWLGHLMFDTIFSVILTTIIVIVFAAASNQFHGLGEFWFVMVLYGITGALFSYCISLAVSSPLAAFAAVAGYQVVMFVLYLAAYLLVLTYAKSSQAASLLVILHFTISIVAPVCSVVRAALVSVNLFSLLCDGNEPVTAKSLGSIHRFGGPILYLFIYSFILLGILVWVDSGSILPRRVRKRRPAATEAVIVNEEEEKKKDDVDAEADAALDSEDLLRVLGVTKAYNGNKVVDDVSLGVSRDTVFALLGPNGAGKTTTFNMIRGDVNPDTGDILIDGISVIRNPRTARLSLGVCPQFTAIDSQLTVREHLIIYGRLKGLIKGPELDESIDVVLKGAALNMYADRLASRLSGGNQRKLALAIALIGNPAVILIDEFSTGIDAKMKRDMWKTLRNVAHGKAVVITTHSMEEASALATRVGILAKRVLAVGTTDSLSARYGTYEVHFTCRTRDEVVKARELMTRIPGSRMADDVATRFEVPIESAEGMSLAQLFHTLSSHGDFTEYTVEKASLESVFLKVIRENDVVEEDSRHRRGTWWRFW
ncbi:P-loop containing nucleoside triphosphate hydrolase protein [Macrolepiota fuliginosa MF-IS2]|uniref:P-loop containing nucleoside triphosphate hydrolase protein n=1 Tax=Macrolepiota fuliginosa MF-IS2 TaxID=1400762 RepID=A0A9P6BXI4_9AGAR|nr:P-loop containing nucleoside triphosphate hydrolase protein [Macrolepiota fuliginosa MF-IS2]